MTKDNIYELSTLRIVVAFLGEKNNWWPTNFFSESAAEFLEYSFPRNKNVGAIAVCDEVKSLLDKKVGANNFHLFRLNVVLEEQIHKLVFNGEIVIESEERALETLEKYAKLLPVDGAAGPKNIGSIDHINEDVINAMAAEYLHAFNNGYQVHPYLN